jgi:hypothetical protein
MTINLSAIKLEAQREIESRALDFINSGSIDIASDVVLALIAAAEALPGALEALEQCKKWIASAMVERGWPQERVDEPPQGSHLYNASAAITVGRAALEPFGGETTK